MLDWNNTYPRPSLKRKGNFKILNEGWKLNDLPINLPFPPESKLSGYKGPLGPEFTYTRELEIPEEAVNCLKEGGELFLHFGAIDQVSDIFVDEEQLGHSELGYFKIDCPITSQAKKAIDEGRKSVLVKVNGQDYLDKEKPYGKQRIDRGGMWYTPISGIWQTVWMEWLPKNYISKIKYSVQGSKVNFTLFYNDLEKAGEWKNRGPVKASIKFSSASYDFTFTGNSFELDLAKIQVEGKNLKPEYWSCQNPYLYQIEFEYMEDRVESYFALRSVSIEDIQGYKRICLNGSPVFFNGVLDQGYFEEGIFTPKSPEDYKNDILRMKELGFNTLRKHIKLEPEIFYYLCDSLGIYLVQDMVNNGPYNFMVDTALATLGIKLKDKNRYSQSQKDIFLLAASQTQDYLFNNPSVIAYTVFNEGWGQTDSDEIGDLLKERDPSRIYDYTSGWFKQKNSDLDSLHIYFRTKKLKAKNKALVLSEFGGFTRAVQGHIWNLEKSFGYGKCKDENELTERIIEVYQKMVLPAIPKGLCACIYTQLSDIEDEINGFYTYDRQVCKVDKEKLSDFMKKVKI
ncbi:MAG: hypothetical protein K6C97_03795 [Treponema sp.]|nr:hypothetical protein [Treponema sp.]